MNTANKTIEALSEKFSRQFTYRMPSAAHMLADLKQEAAIAIWSRSRSWKKDGGANLETYTRIYAWRAMQELCTKQSGPVSKTMVNGKYEGTSYAAHNSKPGQDDGVHADDFGHRFDNGGTPTPEEFMERADADEIVRDFIDRRAARFTGKGKLSVEKIKCALRDLMSGDSCQEIGPRYGVSKQYISTLAAQAEIA